MTPCGQKQACLLTPVPNGTGLALAWHSPMSPYSPIKRRVRKRTVRAAEGRTSIIRMTLNLEAFPVQIQSRARHHLRVSWVA